MARPIDADALKKVVEDFPNCYNGWSDTYDKAFIIGAIEEAPTIDAVSVVRCKDCKRSEGCDQMVLISEIYNEVEEAEPITYCSYGERKERSGE